MQMNFVGWRYNWFLLLWKKPVFGSVKQIHFTISGCLSVCALWICFWTSWNHLICSVIINELSKIIDRCSFYICMGDTMVSFCLFKLSFNSLNSEFSLMGLKPNVAINRHYDLEQGILFFNLSLFIHWKKRSQCCFSAVVVMIKRDVGSNISHSTSYILRTLFLLLLEDCGQLILPSRDLIS